MSTLKTINVIHPSGSTNNIVNDASGNITVGNNLTVTGTLTGSTGVMNIGSGQLYKDSSGNVGIGTNSPADPLNIYNSSPYIRLTDADLSTRLARIGGENGNVTIDIDPNATAAASFFSVDIDNTERARIDSSGNWYMDSGYGSAAVAYGCRAWVLYNGSAQTLTASGGVSSVTYTATGNYLINLSNTMPNANYSIVTGNCALNTTQPGNDGGLRVALSTSSANWVGTPDQSTTSFRLRFGTTGSTFANTSYVSAAIFR